MMTSAAWGGQDQAMGAAPGGEYQQFLDMNAMGSLGDGMHYEFHGSTHAIMAQPRQTADAVMGNTDQSAIMSDSDGLLQQNHTPVMTTAASHASIPAHMMTPSTPDDTISIIDAQIHYLQQQKYQQQQQRQLHDQQHAFYSAHSQPMVPTPQSLEMMPGSGHFYSKPDQQMSSRSSYETGYHQRMAEQQDMSFTPLVSPAVTPLTPLDSHFSIDNTFVVPNTYFSPLTSPALRAHNDATSLYDHSTHSNNSPAEMELELTTGLPTAAAAASTNSDLSKKARRNTNSVSKIRAKPSVKSSPISKPQRRKTGPSPAIITQVLSELDESNMRMADQSLLPMAASSSDGSEENASVSPENLTDMPPPPIPARRSMSMSPYIQAQGAALQSSVAEASLADDTRPHPATPASLMKLPASKASRPTASHVVDSAASDHIESLELPEAISNATPTGPMSTTLPSPSPQFEPKLVRSISFGALPSPSVRTVSASQSPPLPPGTRKTPLLTYKQNRKRSTGSIHVSPALLPRISPSIKPLLPGGSGLSAEDQASRLLMSKSNYQNILEGNQVPGVSYPSELSTNITSKRTSHKIAEQGRRNRINSALQIMAGLLPESKTKSVSGEDSDKKDGKQAHVSNSKASVVENAIEHMKNLERENGDLKQELKALRDRLEKLQGGGGEENDTPKDASTNDVMEMGQDKEDATQTRMNEDKMNG